MRVSLLILILFSSCSLSRIYKWEENKEINYSKKDTKFIIENNRIELVKDSLKFWLDTGGSNAFFGNVPNSLSIADSASFGRLILASGEKSKKKTYLIDKFEFDPIHGSKMPFSMIPDDILPDCFSLNGIIGADSFKGKQLSINFENKSISVRDSFDTSDYFELKVKKMNLYDVFIVEIKINNKTVDVQIDTGTPVGLILTKDNFQKINPINPIHMFHSKRNVNIYAGNCDLIDNQPPFPINCWQLSHIKHNLMGVNFLKHFNWIFDYPKKKLFAQPIAPVSSEKVPDFIFKSKEGNIYLIATTNKEDTKYFNRKITSIDNQLVNDVCGTVEKLNNSNNWKDLNIAFE